MKSWFVLDRKPAKGLLAAEKVMLAYLAFTLLMMCLLYTKLAAPEAMLWGRLRIVVITAALWGVYRLLPCRLTLAARIVAQLALLSWWYPDTYELNRCLPNLDHVFASWEQSLFGCQPALLFCKAMPWAWWSELMDLGYAAYYPMIVAVLLFYFACRYKEAARASFIVLGAFYIYYIIYVLLPVAGPQYYYAAVGTTDIARGVFPNIGDYFHTHAEALASPGWADGLFYQLVQSAHDAGERPTAAFPSSHVGISTIVMLLAWKARCPRLLYYMAPLYALLCLSTVYIYAHYAIDVLAGWATAVAIYFALRSFSFSR